MRFTSTLALTAALVAGAWGNLHDYGLCYYGRNANTPGYHEAATRAACAAYQKRTGGSGQWEKCPDCKIVGSPPTCWSAAWHIGGDQMSGYCKGAGASGSLAS